MAYASILEIPTGPLNASNIVFISSYSMDEAIRIFINGVSYPSDDTLFGFTVTYPYTLTMSTYVPQSDDDLLIEYITHNGI